MDILELAPLVSRRHSWYDFKLLPACSNVSSQASSLKVHTSCLSSWAIRLKSRMTHGQRVLAHSLYKLRLCWSARCRHGGRSHRRLVGAGRCVVDALYAVWTFWMKCNATESTFPELEKEPMWSFFSARSQGRVHKLISNKLNILAHLKRRRPTSVTTWPASAGAAEGGRGGDARGGPLINSPVGPSPGPRVNRRLTNLRVEPSERVRAARLMRPL
ncbi:hypothetical protein EVAR_63314_1 [Eumeta japonica]|uniref:Uncharacterized protein n=1 Tax=Eumeta variegata TaxID=151549 RepID=A0A4C1YRB4_EUMVA|nr:hypothetical protein EVAR_63314_1 [Eumeta japonica]